MKYIDIHCHLDFKYYDADRQEVLARMKKGEVGAITIGTDLESSKKAVEIAEENENIWACIGMHPEKPQGETLGNSQGLTLGFREEEFQKLVQNPKVVAIGECGLDWFRVTPENLESEKTRQTALFKKQIEFALKYYKPLMLHCRDSYDDVLAILESYKEAAGPEAEKLKGNSHFFAGNTEQAKKFLDLGFTMSFTGVITFLSRQSSAKAGTDLYEVIKYLPVESIMSETDAPFVAPVPYRGKRNEPSYVIEVVKKLAELKGVETETMRAILLANAQKLFNVL